MKQNQLNRVLKLIRRTGDRAVIMDQESEDVLVMMNVDEYEKILDGEQPISEMSEKEMMNKITRDISAWRAEHSDDKVAMENWKNDDFCGEDDFSDDETEEGETEEMLSDEKNESADLPIDDQFSDDIDDEDLSLNAESSQKVDTEQPVVVEPINKDFTLNEEEKLDDLPDDGEKEKFYLEPVE